MADRAVVETGADEAAILTVGLPRASGQRAGSLAPPARESG